MTERAPPSPWPFDPWSDSHLAKKLKYEERRIASALWEEPFRIATPPLLSAGYKGTIERHGIVNIFVFNPVDCSFYNRFHDSPTAAAYRLGIGGVKRNMPAVPSRG
jgi:hypothetical protein